VAMVKVLQKEDTRNEKVKLARGQYNERERTRVGEREKREGGGELGGEKAFVCVCAYDSWYVCTYVFMSYMYGMYR